MHPYVPCVVWIDEAPLLPEMVEVRRRDDGRLAQQPEGDVFEDGGHEQIGEDVRAQEDERDEVARRPDRVPAVVPFGVACAERLLHFGVVVIAPPPLARHHLEQEDEAIDEGLEVALVVESGAVLEIHKELRPDAGVEKGADAPEADDAQHRREGDPHRVEQHPQRGEVSNHTEDAEEAERPPHLQPEAPRRGHHGEQRPDGEERLVQEPSVLVPDFERLGAQDVDQHLDDVKRGEEGVDVVLRVGPVRWLGVVRERHEHHVRTDYVQARSDEAWALDDVVAQPANRSRRPHPPRFWLHVDRDAVHVAPELLALREQLAAGDVPKLIDEDADKGADDEKGADAHKEHEVDDGGPVGVALGLRVVPLDVHRRVHDVEPLVERRHLHERQHPNRRVVEVVLRLAPHRWHHDARVGVLKRPCAVLLAVRHRVVARVKEAAEQAHAEERKAEEDDKAEQEH
mmetsp:Transcript_7303/g.24259  ORF Transcript_7303/g.24259 Transcript_7303/m.24259 type:complete len:457 (-) Transcript_7303:3129-4499(-)